MDDGTPPLEPVLEAGRGRMGRAVRVGFGYLIGAVCLLWVFHDIDFTEFMRHVTTVSWGWAALAVVFDVLTYLSQGWRWALLLHPVGRIPILRATQAIYVGLFTNEVLPMRLGEIVRTYLVSQWLPAPFPKVIPSLIVERFLDGVWLALAAGLTIMLIPLPKELVDAGDILGLGILAATGLFFYLVFGKRKTGDEEGMSRRRLLGPVWRLAGTLRSGIRQIGLTSAFYLALGLSLLLLAFQALAYWLVMWACGLRLSFWAGAVVFLVVHLGTAIPNAPANVGSFQFFTVAGLALFGVEKTQAAGFSVVVFLLLTIPLWAIGVFALSRSGTTLATVRREIRRMFAKSRS